MSDKVTTVPYWPCHRLSSVLYTYYVMGEHVEETRTDEILATLSAHWQLATSCQFVQYKSDIHANLMDIIFITSTYFQSVANK